MKRILAIFLAMIMICVSLSGCLTEDKGGEGTNPPTVSTDKPSDTTAKPSGTVTRPDGTEIPVVTLPMPEDTGADEPAIDFEGHADADNDKICDDCGISVVTTFDFYAINDLHGKLADTSTQPGVDELTTFLKNAQKTDDNAIFLSSGDMWQGASESNLTRGLIITDWMNAVGFVSMTLGNHEFDWGAEYIEENAKLANFPLLAINIYEKTTGNRADYCEPSVLVECRGLQVGIIGAIGDCYSSISGDKVGDVYFKTGSELTALVKAESERLRAAGADLIIYSLHDGHGQSSSGESFISNGMLASYYDVSLSDGYVDLVFEGHSHAGYVMYDSKNVYHLQNSGDNGGISHAEIELNFANGSHTVTLAEHVRTSRYESLEGDPIVAELLEKYKDELAKADEVLGQNDFVRDGDTLLELSAQLYFEAGFERWGDKYDIVLGGGFMSVRSPYDLHAGTVTYADLQSLLPFDNQLVLCSVKGRDLVSKFLETSNDRYYIYCGSYGESIRNNINYNDTYYIVTDTYSSTYAPNNLTEIERYDDGIYARDLLAEYIKAGNLTSGPKGLTSISEILSIGWALAPGGETAESYRVRAEIVEVYNTTYGNLIIKDEQGNTLTVYGTWGADGTRYDKMADPPQVGDTVTLEAPIKHYVNASTGEDFVELFQSILIEG